MCVCVCRQCGAAERKLGERETPRRDFTRLSFELCGVKKKKVRKGRSVGFKGGRRKKLVFSVPVFDGAFIPADGLGLQS